jgi:hypothetical protein
MIASPLPLGPFLVEDGGRLVFRFPGAQPGFTFQWRQRRFAVRLRDMEMHMIVPIGRVPSTSAGLGRRDTALALFAQLVRALPQGWSVRLTADHRIQLETRESMAWPSTVAALISPIIALLLRAAPLLDLMDEHGLA